MKKILPVLFIPVVAVLFFWQFFTRGLLPIPSDTIAGLYHPFRDFYAKNYPNGIPFKNFLITDPVRQTYPWRELSISTLKKFELPLWNPYNFSGAPLLANFQSAPLYPLNILFFFLPFSFAWSILIFLEPLLGGIFLYFYLENLRLNKWASVLGGIVFAFSGFSTAWMEWGTITHVILWLPLMLLSIDKIFYYFNSSTNGKLKSQSANLPPKTQNYKIWAIIFIFSIASSFFAGHLQTFFYLSLFSLAYFLSRWAQNGRKPKAAFLFVALCLLFLAVTAIQWFPTLQFVLLSARNADQTPWQNPGWFIPWQNLIQFVAPDFFGNPATLNYWGVWNYAEFMGYIGIFPLIIALFGLFFRRDKKTLFFGTLFFLSLIFSLPTFFAKLPFLLNIPFIDTAQPTRLLFITDFSLSILAALGFDYFLSSKKNIWYPLGFFALIFISLWLFVLLGKRLDLAMVQNLLIAKHNLILPTLIFITVSILLLLARQLRKTKGNTAIIIYAIIAGITIFDLLRFGLKFNPFIKKEYLFPSTSALSFLQKNAGNFRIMTDDSRIFPPNFSVIYRLQSVDGYDPLYLMRYGQLIAASQRGKPDINPPFGFNRIITPHNYNSKIIDLLGVKYVLSLSGLSSPKLRKVFQEGQTRIYENREVLPRVFFVQNIQTAASKDEAISKMFGKNFSLRNTAVIELPAGIDINPAQECIRCGALISNYNVNKIMINTDNQNEGFLVLTDSFYPTWHAIIDEKKTRIYRTDFNFRGIIVPKGKHTVEFYDSLF